MVKFWWKFWKSWLSVDTMTHTEVLLYTSCKKLVYALYALPLFKSLRKFLDTLPSLNPYIHLMYVRESFGKFSVSPFWVSKRLCPFIWSILICLGYKVRVYPLSAVELLGDPEVTAKLYCNFAYPYWEGCVCAVYICVNFWVTQYELRANPAGK